MKWLVIPFVLIVISLDQASKHWVLSALGSAPVDVVPGYLAFDLAYNLGISFSLFGTGELPYQRWLLTGIAVAASVLFAVWLWRSPSKWQQLGLALVIAGALGNAIDRVRIGAVVDFISVHYQGLYYWPTFNLADSAITIGVCVLLLEAVCAKLAANKRNKI